MMGQSAHRSPFRFIGDGIRVSKVPAKESQKRVKKGSLLRVPLVLPRSFGTVNMSNVVY